jgi:putative phosphoesterase
LGVIADTHIPDRRRQIPPQALNVFVGAGVAAILHAGDISTQRVLNNLERIAPVHAVAGNRDWFLLKTLPEKLRMTFFNTKIGLTHGHEGQSTYVRDRLRHMIKPLSMEYFESRALKAFTDVDVIVFGHTHRPINRWFDDVLLFNPGSACCPKPRKSNPSVGLLYISESGDVRSEIVVLPV